MSKNVLMVLAVIVALLAGWLLITLASQQEAEQDAAQNETMMEDADNPNMDANPESVEVSVEVYDPNSEINLTVTP